MGDAAANNPAVIKVFIASPGGLDDERDLVERTVEEAGQITSVNRGVSCQVLRWERGVGDFGRPQEQINALVEICDVFIGLLGDRWGSPTGTYDSGFEEEYEIARQRRCRSGGEIPKIMLFTKSEINPLTADRDQLGRVLDFVQAVRNEHEAWINQFTDAADLVGKCQSGLWDFVLKVIGETPPNADTLADPLGQGVKLTEGQSLEGRPARAEGREPEPALQATTDRREDWKAALTDAPLSEIGELQREREAEQEKDEHPLQAAQAFVEIAEKLEEAGHSALADIYAQRASRLFEDAGETERAAALAEEVGRRQVERGSGLAEPTARNLLDLLEPEDEWRGNALLALALWPEDLEGSIEALREALERLDANGAGDEDPDRLEYTAALVELLALKGEQAEVLAACAGLRETPLRAGPRMRIELDAAEAIEATDGAESGEGAWEPLLELADALSDDDVEAAAVIWQRRGVVLTVRGEVDSAREAFRRAALQWQRRAGNGDQVGEAYFGAQIAAGLNAVFAPEGEALRPLAAHLRGDADTPAARADSLEERGMGQRINDKPLDALRNYSLAFAEHRRAGNLRGMCFSSELLGELYLHAEYPHEAVRAYIRAGREADAAKAAKAQPNDEVLDSLDLGGARWHRAASFAALAAIGRMLTSAGVTRIADQVVEEAQRDFDSIVTPQPAMRAQEALAAIAFELPDESREAGLKRLRNLAGGGFIGTARPASEALQLLTNAGVSDETTTLVEAFLADASLSGISAVWIGERLAGDPDAKQAVLTAAKEGNRDALEAAAVADLVPEDQDLLDLCETHVERAAAQPGIQIHEEDGQEVQTVSVGAGYELMSIEARFVSAELRSKFATALVTSIGDARLPIPNRVSAANGLYNLAASLDLDAREELANTVRPMVDGKVEISPWDEPAGAFSRFQVNFGRKEDLHAAVLSAWARLKGDIQVPWRDDDRAVLEAACVDAKPAIAAAAYESLARLPGTPFPSFAVAGLSNSDGRVRAAAARAWLIRTNSPPPEPRLSDLLSDEWLTVRLALVWNADRLDSPEREELLTRLSEDRDAYVRALARNALKNPPKEGV